MGVNESGEDRASGEIEPLAPGRQVGGGDHRGDPPLPDHDPVTLEDSPRPSNTRSAVSTSGPSPGAGAGAAPPPHPERIAAAATGRKKKRVSGAGSWWFGV